MKYISFFFLPTLVFCFDKWIVVTSIQYPTPQLEKLAKIPGWHLLVVGDKKTPKDWHLAHCEYLSPDDQLRLGYKSATALPWNHYSRKNIGYLYAISKGAKIIYETDDDNEPINELSAYDCETSLHSINTLETCFNIYRYFDCPEVWPRGYPLDKIRSSSAFSISLLSNCIIGVEQGIVNDSPDVDAIFRLTQDRYIKFNDYPPIFLPEGVFCPFNSQNTFIHPVAFFTLYLPSSVSMRISDIWRGYITQKLLWAHNAKLVFSAPNAVQKRNAHSLLQNFQLELDLYLKTPALIDFLSNFHFPPDLDPCQELVSIYEELVARKFIQQSEMPILEAWVEDLQAIRDSFFID